MKRLALIPLVFLLAACGDSSEVEMADLDNGSLPGDYEYGKVTLPDGRVLECVTMERGLGQSSWGGIDCEWPTNTFSPTQ